MTTNDEDVLTRCADGRDAKVETTRRPAGILPTGAGTTNGDDMMGQAFDRDGNVLGEAFGDTKREVFEKLNAEFKQANEIRIKTLDAKVGVLNAGETGISFVPARMVG